LRPVHGGIGRRCTAVLAALILGLILGGCSAATQAVKTDAGPAPRLTHAPPQTQIGTGPDAIVPVAEPAADDAARLLAQAARPAAPPPPVDEAEDIYDPWEPFNEKMFDFNIKLDRHVLKPVARVWRVVVPEPFQIMISNGLDNIRVVPRFVNNVLQGKFEGAGREAARFLINSTAGVAGLFDPAKDYWGIRPSSEDFGQTLGTWGAGPGPYLVLPVLAPTTVRDGVGMGVDLAIDPIGYFIPFLPTRLLMKITDTVNDRALNYDLFQGVEETTIDLYSSVRHFYLKRREQQIKD
jgi:phospholipid-binding lipoprotein MlaA